MPIELRCPAGGGVEAKARILARRGGLLTDLTLACGGRAVDVLWMPEQLSEDETGWPGGGMPLMFPFAGRVFYNGQPFQYELGGELYNMPLHGFAYALPWQVVQQSASAATLAVTAGARTEPLFPYDFALDARYELAADQLAVTVGVENRGLLPGARRGAGLPVAMPVALGFHPYFRMPLLPGGDKARCRLQTTARERVAVTPAGGAGKATEMEAPTDATGHPLDQPLLANLILGKHAEPRASLADLDAGVRVTVGWDSPERVRYTVLWTKEGQDFHCLEPWMGLPDAVSTGAGVVWLEPGQRLQLGFTVSVAGTASR